MENARAKLMPQYLTVEEVAEIMHLSIPATYRAVRANQIHHIRVGRRIRIPRSAVIDL